MDHTVSGLESLAREFFKEALPNERVLYNERFSWLLIFNPNFNKKTERELDIYFPDLGIAIEVNGTTHHHSSVRKVDKKKQLLCTRNNVVLYEVWNEVDMWELRYIFSKQFPDKIAPEISKDLRERIETYYRKGNARHNAFLAGKLLQSVDKKRREEKANTPMALKAKRPKQHKEHMLSKEKALQKLKRRYRERELAYAMEE